MTKKHFGSHLQAAYQDIQPTDRLRASLKEHVEPQLAGEFTKNNVHIGTLRRMAPPLLAAAAVGGLAIIIVTASSNRSPVVSPGSAALPAVASTGVSSAAEPAPALDVADKPYEGGRMARMDINQLRAVIDGERACFLTENAIIIWPAGFSLREDRRAVLDASGNEVARTGQPVSFQGGLTGSYSECGGKQLPTWTVARIIAPAPPASSEPPQVPKTPRSS